MSERKIRVTQVRSGSGKSKRDNKTLEALGLGKIGKSREYPLNGAVLGMVRRVHTLVSVEEIK